MWAGGGCFVVTHVTPVASRPHCSPCILTAVLSRVERIPRDGLASLLIGAKHERDEREARRHGTIRGEAPARIPPPPRSGPLGGRERQDARSPHCGRGTKGVPRRQERAYH